MPQGVVAFSELPTSGLVAGHLYAVKDKFITDSRFEEGEKHQYPAGTCVYWTKDNKWKVLSGVLSLELTKAEYDALTDAQKKNGTIYYVKDADNLIEADEINGLAVVATSGNYNDLKNKPSSLPASDVSDWAKAKTKPSYTAGEVGLGNVGNFKAVSTVSGQGLSDAEKSNARANIGAQAAGTYLTEHQDISGKLDNTATGANSLLSNLTASWTAAPTDDTNFIRQDIGGKSEFGRVKFSTLWTFIKGKADKVYSAIGHKHIKADITDFPTSMAANGGDSSTVNGHTVNSNVPANAKFTDTNTWRPQPDWNATSGDAVIKNKPTIPSVGNGTVTITQNGISKGIFTMNQSGNTTIALTDTNTTYSVATTSANGLMSKDMVTKLNNITSGANGVIQVLTASQYNALSEAQKKNGTIYLVN